MRNPAVKSRGIGFAQAGNFYPDFLLWMIDKTSGQQYLTFIDPKGLRNLAFDSPKLNFAAECKNLQNRLNQGKQDKLIINSVILSDTSWTDLLIQTHAKAEWEAKNVFFLEDGGTSYLLKLFTAAKVE